MDVDIYKHSDLPQDWESRDGGVFYQCEGYESVEEIVCGHFLAAEDYDRRFLSHGLVFVHVTVIVDDKHIRSHQPDRNRYRQSHRDHFP